MASPSSQSDPTSSAPETPEKADKEEKAETTSDPKKRSSYDSYVTRNEAAMICRSIMNDNMPMHTIADRINDFAILAVTQCDEEIETADVDDGASMTARQAGLLNALRERRQMKMLDAIAAAGVQLTRTDRPYRRDVARQLADAIIELAK